MKGWMKEVQEVLGGCWLVVGGWVVGIYRKSNPEIEEGRGMPRREKRE